MAISAPLILIALAMSSAIAYDPIFYGSYTLPSSPVPFNFLPIIRNQNQPVACDASWAFAITSVMSAKFNFLNLGAKIEVNLSPQMLINCTDQPFNCQNADTFNIEGALDKLKTFGVSDESCNNYYASGTADCSNLNRCKDCANGEDIHKAPVCHAVDYHEYKLSSWSKIVSSQTDPVAKTKDLFVQVYNSLKNKGPVLCKIVHDEGIFSFRTNDKSTYKPDPKNPLTYNTWVSVVGFGDSATAGTSAFGLQVSFGDNVGADGIVMIDAGETLDTLNMLDTCYELNIDPNVNVVQNKVSTPTSVYNSLLGGKTVKKVNTDVSSKHNHGLVRSTPVMKKFNEGITITADPTPINWSSYNGRNLLTYTKNQHIPTYCGSCWIQAAISVLADRLNIVNFRNNVSFPRYVFSAQAVINCRVAGTCYGGDSSLFFEKAKTWKLPVETCQTYQAHNPDSFVCPPNSICSNQSKTQVYPYASFRGTNVKDWGRIRGSDAMKAALVDGPIVCDMQVTDGFEGYKRSADDNLNIYDETLDYFSLNHAISIVGWDKNDKGEYWIGRNSWGKEWGYDGLFYIKAGNNVLGIESDCSYANPLLSSY